MSDTTLVGERPTPGAPRSWHFPAFERHHIGGGQVIACDLPGKPLAVISLVADAGAVAEPSGREGVALLVARALSEGTTTRGAYDFAVAGERLGASWRADTDWDSLRAGFEVPAGELSAAAELLAEAVRSPAFDDATLARVRDERLDEVLVDLSQPGTRAAVAFGDAVFDAASRYSLPDGGDVDTLTAVTADDIRDFHRQRLAPSDAALIVVGDLTGVDVSMLGRTVFDSWRAEPAPDAHTVADVRDEKRRVVLVDRPGSVQSMLYVGHDGPPRATPDYVPMTTMSLALGGMFNSRLNYRLREDKGYTYGAHGGFDCRRNGGVFAARAAVQTEVTAPALTAMVTEIVRMHDDGLTADELERARSYRAGIFPVNFAGAGAVASGLGDLVVHQHPDDHFDRLRQAILDVTLDDVNAAARRRLHPDRLVCVVVGDAATIADELRAADLGPVDIVSDDN